MISCLEGPNRGPGSSLLSCSLRPLLISVAWLFTRRVIADLKETEVVYAGPWNGFAQVALAIACKLCGKTATVFMTRDDYKTNIRARMYVSMICLFPCFFGVCGCAIADAVDWKQTRVATSG